jgi:cytochrome P450
MHSEELFERPWEFLPDRYIGKDGRINKSVPDPEIGAFGYGRRYVRASPSTLAHR